MVDWHYKRIGELCEFSNGHGFTPRDWAKSGWPIIRIQNLNGSEDFNYYNSDPDPSWIVEPGELLYAWAGVPGVSFGPTVWRGPRGVLNQHIYRITPNDGIDKDWLYAAMKVVTSRIERKAHGFKSSLLHVKKSDITGQKIHLPTKEEQKEIARLLAVYDRCIDLVKSMINAKQDGRKWLIQQLLSGQRRLPGFDMPWKKYELAFFFKEFSTLNRENRNLIPLSCSKVHGIVPQSVLFDKRVASTDIRRYKIVSRGDLIYDPMLLWDASIGFQEAVDEGVISPAYCTFKFNEGNAYKDYFRYFFKSHYIRHQYKIISQGTNVRRRKAPSDAFLEIGISMPTDMKEQEAIVKIFDLADLELEFLLQQHNALLDQQKGLMLLLVSGKVRVNL